VGCSDLRAKAFTILMEAARERQKGLVNYNIDSVLEDTLVIEKLGIKLDDHIKNGTKALIAMFIAQIECKQFVTMRRDHSIDMREVFLNIS